MKNRHYFFSFLTVIFLLIVILFSFKNYSNFESTDNAYVRGSITTISSRIEGYVIEVPGVLNTEINKGDILAKFDDAPFIAMVNKSKAELKASEAQLSEVDLKQETEKLKIEEQKLQLKLAQNNIHIIVNTSFNISKDPLVFDLFDVYTNMRRMNIKYVIMNDGIFKIKEI